MLLFGCISLLDTRFAESGASSNRTKHLICLEVCHAVVWLYHFDGHILGEIVSQLRPYTHLISLGLVHAVVSCTVLCHPLEQNPSAKTINISLSSERVWRCCILVSVCWPHTRTKTYLPKRQTSHSPQSMCGVAV